MSEMASTSPTPTVEPAEATREEQQRARLWNVILHDDQLHTYEYVVEMLCKIFTMDVATAYRHAMEVDSRGTTNLARLPKPEAVTKRNAVLRFGGDPRLNTSISMIASIAPCEEG